ncbi:conserved hypothetical protein [Ricinus communis]|uniref:Uncharacterized protein n=1 Tax=Ricinus communis TaxID=3988 RepID=B9SVI0_RICCO|nr:conserved hypothetical protein [Ricinus communis]
MGKGCYINMKTGAASLMTISSKPIHLYGCNKAKEKKYNRTGISQLQATAPPPAIVISNAIIIAQIDYLDATFRVRELQ